MKERMVLIGAGSAMFTRGLVLDLIRKGEETELALVDTDPESLEIAERLVHKMIQSRRAPITLSASTDRRKVLPGASVIICTIGVGGRRAWEQDVFIPRKYGVYQPVGDSVMPGGLSRALRMIPAMVAIAEDARELAPGALFFNYGNPMTAVCRAVRKATGAPVVGLCHGVNWVGHYLAGALGVSPQDFSYTAVGLNHLTWFTEFSIRGVDATTAMMRAAEERRPALDPAELGRSFAEAGTERREGDKKSEDSPLSWELFRLFGAFPSALDRHVSEFFPQLCRKGAYYQKTLGVNAFSFEQTIAYGDKIFDEMKDRALSSEPLGDDYFEEMGGEHEQVIAIIESIRRDRGNIYSANLPNQGQVPNLPEDVILESPARAARGGLHPLPLKPLSDGVLGTVIQKLACVETIVEAALEGSRRKFVQALVLDGALSSPEEAERLADELLRAQAQYLPQFSGDASVNA